LCFRWPRLLFSRDETYEAAAEKSQPDHLEKASTDGTLQRATPEEVRTPMQLSGRFESITQRIVIPPLKSALFALPFASLDQMLQAARSLYGRFATFRTTFLSLHAQLVLALP